MKHKGRHEEKEQRCDRKNIERNGGLWRNGRLDRYSCSTCERQRHNLFYVDNAAQVGGGLRGMLSEEECVV